MSNYRVSRGLKKLVDALTLTFQIKNKNLPRSLKLYNNPQKNLIDINVDIDMPEFLTSAKHDYFGY